LQEVLESLAAADAAPPSRFVQKPLEFCSLPILELFLGDEGLNGVLNMVPLSETRATCSSKQLRTYLPGDAIPKAAIESVSFRPAW
jgi:hypothetical protein